MAETRGNYSKGCLGVVAKFSNSDSTFANEKEGSKQYNLQLN